MGFLNSLLGKAVGAAAQAAGTKEIRFPSVPFSLQAFQALPQALMETPYDTASLTVLALSLYPGNRDLSLSALDFLRGPNPLSGIDKQFIADRFTDKKDYVPRSYFNGATPQNDYTPSQPWTVAGQRRAIRLAKRGLRQAGAAQRRRGQHPSGSAPKGEKRQVVSVGTVPPAGYPSPGEPKPVGIK